MEIGSSSNSGSSSSDSAQLVEVGESEACGDASVSMSGVSLRRNSVAQIWTYSFSLVLR